MFRYAMGFGKDQRGGGGQLEDILPYTFFTILSGFNIKSKAYFDPRFKLTYLNMCFRP